jgi:O-antigen/teichoic acid export membrane protein
VKIIRNQFTAILEHIRVPFYTNAYALILLQVSAAFFGFLFWAIATRTNKPSDIGIGAALLSAGLLIVSISILGFDDGLTFYLPHSADPNALISTSFSITVVFSGLLAALFILGSTIWSPSLSNILNTPIAFFAFIACVVILQISTMQDGLYVSERISKYALFKGVSTNLLRIPLFLLLLSVVNWNIILSATLALWVGIIFSFLVYRKRQRKDLKYIFPKVSLELKSMSRFSFGNYLTNMIVALPNTLLPLILLEKLGTEANAYFYIAWIIGGMINVIGRSFGTSLFVESSHDRGSLEKNTWRSLKTAAIIVIPTVIGFSLIANELLLFLGKDYGTYSTMLVIMIAISSIPLTIHGISVGVLKARGKIIELLWIAVVFTGLHIGLSIFFATSWGLMGVGYAIIIARTLSAILAWILVMYYRKKDINNQRVLPA